MNDSTKPSEQRDFFISYAREDEETLAQPLAKAFQFRGVTFWLDRVDLRADQILEDDIQHGLLASRHAVVIVSRNFLQKDWPKRELDILLTIEAMDERRKIVIVRHEMTQSELEGLAPLIAQRTSICSGGDVGIMCSQVMDLARQYEREPQQPGEIFDTRAIFATFYAKNVFKCTNSKCPWKPDPALDRIGLGNQGPEFTFMRRQQDWYVTCTSCGSAACGPVGMERARWLLTFLRMNIFAPSDSPYLNTSLLSKEYLALIEKGRSLTRGEVSAVSRNGGIEEWVAAREAYAAEIELAMQMGKISAQQYEELDKTNIRHREELNKALARSSLPATSAPQPDVGNADEDAFFPAGERNRIRRDLSTLLSLPPAVRGDLSADLRERMEKFIVALAPLRECADHPRAQLYTGCLFYWSCKRAVAAGTEAERAAMNMNPFTIAGGGVIVGYFLTAEYFLDLYRAADAGNPDDQELLHEVESWMNAIRAQQKATAEMLKWTKSN